MVVIQRDTRISLWMQKGYVWLCVCVVILGLLCVTGFFIIDDCSSSQSTLHPFKNISYIMFVVGAVLLAVAVWAASNPDYMWMHIKIKRKPKFQYEDIDDIHAFSLARGGIKLEKDTFRTQFKVDKIINQALQSFSDD
jgi:hypothetical protein